MAVVTSSSLRHLHEAPIRYNQYPRAAAGTWCAQQNPDAGAAGTDARSFPAGTVMPGGANGAFLNQVSPPPASGSTRGSIKMQGPYHFPGGWRGEMS